MKKSLFLLTITGLLILSGCGKNPSTPLSSAEHTSRSSSSFVSEDIKDIRGANFKREVDYNNGYFFQMDNVIDKAPNTVEAWVKIDPSVKTPGIILSNDQCEAAQYFTGHTESEYGQKFLEYSTNGSNFTFYVDDDGHPAIVYYTGVKKSISNNKGSVRYVVNSVDVRTNQWVHIAFARKIANDNTAEIFFYMNGEKVEKKAGLANHGDITLEDPMLVGGSHIPCNTLAFDGMVKDIRCWSTYRSEYKVKGSMNKTISPSTEGLVANYVIRNPLTDTPVLYDETTHHDAYRTPVWLSKEDYKEPDYDFSFAILGDTQTLAYNYQDVNIKLNKYIAQNKDKYKIQAVLNTGDVGNGDYFGSREKGAWEKELANAKEANSYLTKAGLPMIIAPGNHDYEEAPSKASGERDLKLFNNTFPLSDVKSLPCFYESFKEAGNKEYRENTAFKFEVQGHKFLIISLELGPRQAVVDWAEGLIQNNPTYDVICLSHAGVSTQSRWDKDSLPGDYWYLGTDCLNGEEIFNNVLKKYSNTKMWINGHYCAERFGRREDTANDGHKIHSLMIDYTDTEFNRGGMGCYSLLGFSNGGKTCTVTAYSVTKSAYYLGSANIYTFDF